MIPLADAAQAQVNTVYEPYEWAQTSSAVILIQRPTLGEERSRITCWNLRGAPQNITAHYRAPELPSISVVAEPASVTEMAAASLDYLLHEREQPVASKPKPARLANTPTPAPASKLPKAKEMPKPPRGPIQLAGVHSYLGGRL